ncbi:MAG: ABC transporter permease [Actinomycetaceae bacterium]|nr:ABC transporter permease [Actinomycetaceae bacterium]
MRSAVHFLRFTRRSVKLAYRNYIFQFIVTLLTTTVVLSSVLTWHSLKSDSEEFVTKLAAGTQLVISSPTSKGVDVDTVQSALDSSDYETLVASRFDTGKLNGEDVTLIGIDVIGKDIQSEMMPQNVDDDTLLFLGPSVQASSHSANKLSLGKNDVEIESEHSLHLDNHALDSVNNGNFAVIPIALYASLSEDNPQTVFVALPSGMSVENAQKTIADKLPFYDVKPLSEYVDSINNQYALMTSVSYLFALCFVLGALVLIYVSTVTEISRRRKQFLILRLVGCQKGKIFSYGILESLIFTIIPVALGVLLAHSSVPAILTMIPPALLTNLPITPAYVASPRILLGVAAMILVGACLSRIVALRKIVKNVDKGLVYLRSAVQVDNTKKRVLISGVLTVLFPAGALASPTYSQFLAGLTLLAAIPLLLFVLEKLLSAFALTYRRGIRSVNALKLARNLKKKYLIVAVAAIAVAVPVSAMISTQALLNKGNESVESLRENDYYLQSSSADSFPVKEFATPQHVEQLSQVEGVEAATPGLLLPISIKDRNFTVQFVSDGTHMPAAVNAGDDALSQLFHDSHTAIVSRKAAGSLGVDVGDSYDMAIRDESAHFRVVGISDYIGINDGQIVLNYSDACEAYGLCNASYVELQTVNHGKLSKDDVQAIDFLLDNTEVHLVTGEEEYSVLGQSITATSALSVILAIQLSFIMLVGLFAIFHTELEGRLGEVRKLHRLGCVSRPESMLRGSGIVTEHLVVNLLASIVGAVIAAFWCTDFTGYLEKSISVSGLSSDVSLATVIIYAFAFYIVLNLLSLAAIRSASKKYARQYLQ